jgi:AbrB family looped-hinge helix DNA binding protein
MPTTVTTKGQVTIPKRIRDHLGIAPGTKVDFKLSAHGEIILVKTDETPRPNRFAALYGIAGPGMTTEEVMAMTRGDD